MRLQREQGQAATETMLSMMFMLMMIFGSVQLCWWSMNKYLANLAAFGAARTAMVGGPSNEQMVAARQLYNSRGTGAAPRLVSMSRNYGGSGGGGGGTGGGLLNGVLNGLRQGLQGPLNLLVPPLHAQSFGGGLGGVVGNVSDMLFHLGLPTNLGDFINGAVSGLLGGGGGGRERTGVAYVVQANGGMPIQESVRVVGWSHAVIQPNVPETGDNAGGYYGPGGGFGGLFSGLSGMLGNMPQIINGTNINQLIQGATNFLQQRFGPSPPGAGGGSTP